MSKSLIIAEKPSVANDLARALGGFKKVEDHFENGTMTFDYRMRPGVVEKSNALALMRAIGLEV